MQMIAVAQEAEVDARGGPGGGPPADDAWLRAARLAAGLLDVPGRGQQEDLGADRPGRQLSAFDLRRVVPESGRLGFGGCVRNYITC